MTTTKHRSSAQIERHLAAIAAAERMAGEEPTADDMEAARRVLSGEATAAEVIAEGLAELEAKYGFTR